jgi:small subunit ribosomal protein S1
MYRRVNIIADDGVLVLSDEQRLELVSLYEGTAAHYKIGGVIEGKVVSQSGDGLTVDIGFKSDGIIPLYEFTDVELKKFIAGAAIEVMLDELENLDGNVTLSYEKAKASKSWAILMKLYEEGKPVEGVVTHKVKGGLSVDIGVPAFLPGSQVDIQRVMDFDTFVGQTITAYIIKVNQKRGNVIISRRKFLSEQRAESRKKVLDILSVGQVIQGQVKNITNYGAFVDIGGVDGLLHITDMTWGRIAHPSELLHIGDTITVKVLTLDKEHEKISLGLKQLDGNPWERLAESIQVGSRIKGTVASITDYGLFVEVQKGIEGLVHISEVSWVDRIADLHKHFKVGDTLEAIVVSLDKENRRMSLSIKQLEQNPWDAVVQQFTVGQKVKGKISNITEFGIFVQLMPGIDGLVHISDLSWTEHIKHPADMYKKGDEVEAVVTDINQQKKKISLGVKQLTENPWNELEKLYPIGSLVQGEVTKITDFGAFIKLPSGIEGLVHISELSGQMVHKVEDVLHVGQKAEFRVIKVNQEEHKLGLSLKPEVSPEEHAAVQQERAEQRAKKQNRSERKERPSHDSGSMSSSSSSRPKSTLQLELERLAARTNDNSDTSTSNTGVSDTGVSDTDDKE